MALIFFKSPFHEAKLEFLSKVFGCVTVWEQSTLEHMLIESETFIYHVCSYSHIWLGSNEGPAVSCNGHHCGLAQPVQYLCFGLMKHFGQEGVFGTTYLGSAASIIFIERIILYLQERPWLLYQMVASGIGPLYCQRTTSDRLILPAKFGLLLNSLSLLELNAVGVFFSCDCQQVSNDGLRLQRNVAHNIKVKSSLVIIPKQCPGCGFWQLPQAASE